MVSRDGQTPRLYIELVQVEGAPDGIKYPARVPFLPDGYFPEEYWHVDNRLYLRRFDPAGNVFYVDAELGI